MFFSDYHFFGMHFIWWAFWIFLMFLLFGWFEPVPKKRIRRDSPLEILKRRFASGEINEEEYLAKKRMIEDDNAAVSASHTSQEV